ncbi:YceI family protein [Changchengzhania lutea]|uniref:YceI family protein n=1 Tax=Changchengzhania lutea TaxID=2049305 RepID=UPI00115E086A|nr:YceI family protein [Changchengzhania lutea]
MKNKFATIFIMSALTVSVMGCKDKANEATTTEAEEVMTPEVVTDKYIADVETSTITWTGYKPTGSHTGNINLENGVLNTADGKIAGGTFLIDMASLKDGEGSAKLEGHLKSPDFFDVENHPTAAFEITGLEEVDGKMMLSGNLALKDVKNNVTFPVSVSNDGDMMTLTSDTFTIDRSKWNVKYGSKSFFDDLGDKFINDDIELKIMVKAKKA